MSDETPAAAIGIRPIELTSQELSSVERYRQLRQTSVLVILFTDIKGFTEITERRGERHALDLLKRHDEILVKAIEEDNGGLVVKHIGDSVMAVFSEPSTAVERALRIQERIRAYNEGNPDDDGLAVRIGLHMGQVAVENQTQLDLFGRHVNRASRVEGLADAGQIYLTYPVFDSARGWLASGKGRLPRLEVARELAAEGHQGAGRHLRGGRYPARAAPAAEGGPAHAHLPPLLAVAAILVAGAAITFGAMQIRRTEVWVERVARHRDHRGPEGEAGARRRAVGRAAQGDHPPQARARTCCGRTSTGRSRTT